MDEAVPLPDDPGTYTYPTMGDAENAPTATVYGNFKCPYTREFVLGNLDDIVTEFVETGRLAIQFCDLAYEPGDTSTTYISGSDPQISAFALGVWAEDPNSYWRFYAETFQNQPEGNVSYDELASRAEAAGVSNVDAIVERTRSGTYDGAIEQAAAEAADDGVTYTPTFELSGETTAPHHDTQAILDWIESRVDDAPTETDDGASTESDGGEETESGDDTGGDADGGTDEPTDDEADVDADGGAESDGDEGSESGDDADEVSGSKAVKTGEDEFEWVSNPEEPAATGDLCS